MAEITSIEDLKKRIARRPSHLITRDDVWELIDFFGAGLRRQLKKIDETGGDPLLKVDLLNQILRRGDYTKTRDYRVNKPDLITRGSADSKAVDRAEVNKA